MEPMAPGQVHRGLLVVISAPSGGGKTTLCEQLLASDPRLRRVVTCTTRAPRGVERDGVDYHFLDAAGFARGVAAGEFLEHAEVFGRRYGTRRRDVEVHWAAGHDVLLNIDVQGAASVRSAAAGDAVLRAALVSIFLTPSSLAVLEERLRRRGTEGEAAIRQRLAVARSEMARWREFDYRVVSGSIAEDLRRGQAVIEAERLRSARVRGWVEEEAL